MDRRMEIRHLALADRNIAEGEARVDQQVELIGRLKLRGANTDTAEEFLILLRQTLAGWNRERDMIVLELGRSSSGWRSLLERSPERGVAGDRGTRRQQS